jgi:hypothetical protein
VATMSTSSVIRSILSQDLNLSAAEVVQKAHSQGLKASPDSIRGLVYNIRGEIKQKMAAQNGTHGKAAPAAKASPTKPPAAKTMTATPRIAIQPSKAAVSANGKPSSAPTKANLTGVLATVASVHRVVGLCGGIENARQAGEAVRTCGGVDEFLQHLDLLAGISVTPSVG